MRFICKFQSASHNSLGFYFEGKKTLIKICTFFSREQMCRVITDGLCPVLCRFFRHTFWFRQNTYAENRKIAWFIGGNWLIKEVRPEHQKYVAWQRNSLTCLHFIWIGGYISGHCIDHTNGFAHIFCHCDFPLVFLFCCSFFFYLVDCAEKNSEEITTFYCRRSTNSWILRVVLLYFGLSLHFSWISHQFPTDLKPFTCFIILWIQCHRSQFQSKFSY